MKPRCTGTKVDGHFTNLVCVLDDKHDGFCEPYVAPTVDEWRALTGRASGLVGDALRLRRFSAEAQADCDAAHEREDRLRGENARLQSELDALRAIIESGAESTKSASDLLARVNAGDYRWPSGVAWAVREAHRRLTGGAPDGVYVRGTAESGKGGT